MHLRTRRTLALLATTTAAALACLFGPAGAAGAAPATTAAHHVVAYYQTQYSGGGYVSPKPLAGTATDIDVAALHLNGDGSVHLNDDPPSDPKFDQMWSDLAALQSSGTRVEAMLGGAGRGSYANLHNDFDRYYGPLRDTLREHHFDGVDLDIEETFSLADTEHLINQLRADFGAGFTITMAPVASDLSGGSAFSGGFSYRQLEQEVGGSVSWYNAQFYCGWGDLGGTSGYDAILGNGFSASRVVTGAVTNPGTCGGYVEPGTLAGTVRQLVSAHPDFAGVAGWEYFNAVGVDGGGPASWYANLKNAMG
ncbi:glycosyl hydrolase family 18 protein [Streptomyces sp. NPDC059740]|uniref:glycosyl hydrolase family 18 protein n=1 Tax=Streptomyces sp. NPDC059740 TaxID=3346926 RepID=UPI0036558069